MQHVPDLSRLIVVDLSMTLDEHLPVSWPGAAVFHHHRSNDYADGRGVPADKGPYTTHTLILDEHAGTHFDAPSHFIPPPTSGLPRAGPAGLLTGDVVPLRELMGPAVVIDCRDSTGAVPGQSPVIGVQAVERHEALHGQINPGEVVLFHTGWDAKLRDLPAGRDYVHRPFVLGDSAGWPAPDVETVQLLHSRGVRLLATDGTSMGLVHDGAPVHWWGLSNGMLFVEACVNLGALPTLGAWFLFLPLKVAGSSGAPGRAIAFVEEPR